MYLREIFDKFGFRSVRLSAPFADVELELTMYDEEAPGKIYSVRISHLFIL